MKLLLLLILISLPVVVSSWSLIPSYYHNVFDEDTYLDTVTFGMSPMLRALERNFANPSPRYNMIDDDNEMKLSLDVPGVKPENIEVKVDNDHNMITVSGHRETEDENGSTTSTYQFSNSFSFSQAVISDEFTADLHDGVLTITAPKDMKRLEAHIRKIPITSSSSTANTVVDEPKEEVVAMEEEEEILLNEEEPKKKIKIPVFEQPIFVIVITE